MRRGLWLTVAAASTLAAGTAGAAAERARDLGIPFQGQPGPLNAITDVPGVEVGQTTVIRGEGQLVDGKGPVRTGVTVIFPLGRNGQSAVSAGRATFNGTGEMTGTSIIDELGQLSTPIALTGTGNLSDVHRAVTDWLARPGRLPAEARPAALLPVVGETLDLALNDVFGHPLSTADVVAALDGAKVGPVEEGNVGGGTGMVAYYFKGGIGTASRVIEESGRKFTVGVLLQANHGARKGLRIAGVPVGEEIKDLLPQLKGFDFTSSVEPPARKNSLLIVIGTDAPLDSRQLSRLARRAMLGIGRNGSIISSFSGEFALAFSVANKLPHFGPGGEIRATSDGDSELFDKLFAGVVQAVEEALVNQLVASRTMRGIDGNVVHGLPIARRQRILKAHGRLQPPANAKTKGQE